MADIMPDDQACQAATRRFKERIGGAAWDLLPQRLGELNRDIATRGILPYRNQADLLTGYSYGEFYDWDLYFENLYLSYYGIGRFCRTNLERFLDQQHSSGFISRSLILKRDRQHFKPFLAQIALLGARQLGGFTWLQGRYFERLERYLDYWFWYCDLDKNGLCVWDSADHSGMDNQDSRAGGWGSSAIEGVDLNCYLARELRAMAVIAEALGLSRKAVGFTEHAQRLEQLIDQTFWDETDGFYYDRHEREGRVVRVKSVAGFIPLWALPLPQARADRLVREHLLNPAEFWRPFPVASYAKTEPDHHQQLVADNCNWRGPVWIPTNYMIAHGLRRAGFVAEAKDLAYRTFAMVLAETSTREYYNAETGCGLGLDPFWGWSSLAYLMPLEQELGYDPTDPACPIIQPLAARCLGLRFPS